MRAIKFFPAVGDALLDKFVKKTSRTILDVVLVMIAAINPHRTQVSKALGLSLDHHQWIVSQPTCPCISDDFTRSRLDRQLNAKRIG